MLFEIRFSCELCRKFGAFVRVQRGAREIFENQKLQPTAEIQLWCYRSLVISVINICSAAFYGWAPTAFFDDHSSWSIRDPQRSATADTVLPLYLFGFLLIGIVTSFFDVLISSRRPLQPSFVEFRSSSRPPGYFPLVAFLPAYILHCIPALLCCNVVFRVNLLRISLTYF